MIDEKAPRISVVVPTYNRRDSILRLLRALVDQDLERADFEVIVSVDGSEDGTVEAVQAFEAPYALRVIDGPNRGCAAARNSGIAQARGELLVLLDDDMEPAPGLLAAHLRAHEGAERVGVLGPVPVRIDDATPPVVRFVGRKFNAHLHRLSDGADIEFRAFYSGNCSIETVVLAQAGRYDESFRIYGNEDTELSLRLRAAGVRLIYEPAAIAYQNYEKTFAELARDNEAKGRTAVLATRKHPEEFGPFTVKGFRAASGKWRRSRRWMLVRGVVLAAMRAAPGTAELLMRAVAVAERRRVSRLNTIYAFVIDCFFWAGAGAAIREGSGLESGVSIGGGVAAKDDDERVAADIAPGAKGA